MPLHKIRLHLARDAEHPDGDRNHGYELILPLDSEGRIDLKEWREHREACKVTRFHPDEEVQQGHIVHKAGGAGGATWVFHYDVVGDPEDDETGFHFENHRFVKKDYVSIREQDEETYTFLIIGVTQL